MKRIGIVGAGLVGRVLALSLRQRGHHVSLYDLADPFDETPAGMTAAGMLAVFAELESAESEVFAIGQRSIELWPQLLAQLNSPVAMDMSGSLVLAHHGDRAELQHFMNELQRKVPEASEIQRLNATQLAALEPELSQHSEGFYLPQEGWVDAQSFMRISAETLLADESVTWHSSTPIDSVESLKDEFDWVFDCRGLGAKEAFKVRGVRGEVLWLEAPEVNLKHAVRLMHPRYRIYICPRPHNRYIVGATEIESEDLSPISVRSALELLSAVYTVHTGFAEARIIKTLTNCRPALPNNLPKIEHSERLTRINGLYRHGYLMAPALVEEAIHAVENQW